ncbi:hypothetical protein MD484_g4342, partial [Candolleomyces efflorescens]
MGQTGSGKSTFVNNVLKIHHGADGQNAPTSDGFKSCTVQLAHYIVPLLPEWQTQYKLDAERRVVLVDTPGFDDTSVSDSEILRRIAVWLAASYNLDMKVAGIVYVHPIYPNRMTRNDCSNVKVFRNICGEGGLSKVVLATTRWDICPPETGDKREGELVANFWTNLLIDPKATQGKDSPPNRQAEQGRAQMMRLHDSKEGAQRIVERILEGVSDTDLDSGILNIQDQLMKMGKKFQQTDAAVELRKKLLDLLKESGSSSSESRRERLRSLMQQVSELKIPLGARIKAMLGLA